MPIYVQIHSENENTNYRSHYNLRFIISLVCIKNITTA